MSRSFPVVLILSLVLAGCGRQADPKVEVKVEDIVVAPPGKPAVAIKLIEVEPVKSVELKLEPVPLFSAEPANEKYDAALTKALTLLADQDYAKALEAFEEAKREKDTEFVSGEIAKLHARLEGDAVAVKTVHELQIVLDTGDPKEARKLIEKALLEFGGGSQAARLIQLQAQADALVAFQTNEDAKVRFQRLRDQGQVAIQDNNLRAAVAAFQQALQIVDDAGLHEQMQELQGRLDKYDSLRRRAAELRREPNDIDDALELYKEAALAWNTPDVRHDIDDCATALSRRRDTISALDFEVQSDIGVAAAGRILAEELLPTFKSRFDIVDRSQIANIVQDLNLPPGFQHNPDEQREIAKLARVRFMVLGSVRRLGAVTVQARLVDTTTGLVVQTGKISAPTFEQVLSALPALTKQLLMTDEEKAAFDQVQIQVAQRIAPVAENAVLPPLPVAGAPGAGPWFEAAPPPAFGPLQVVELQALPPPPALPLTNEIGLPPAALRSRLVNVAVLQGDGFFARGHYREAYRQYEFALSLTPGDFDIRARLDACRPLLPPGAIVPVMAVRPRLAILNFMVVGDPRVVPPGLSLAAPDLLAPYLRMHYDIVDSGEVYWMMARLGLTQYDLTKNPYARFWLGRALHANFFLLGTIEQTASFDVSTYLVNADHGWLQGAGRIHVNSPFEFKMRAGELAQITQLPPAQRSQFLAVQPKVNVLFAQGQDNFNRGNFQVAISLFQSALVLRPGNVQAMVYLNQAQNSQRQWDIEQARRKQFVLQQAAAQAAHQRQIELAHVAEVARVQAAQQAAARAEVDRIALAQQRANAYGDMVAKARIAVNARNFGLAVNLFQGALDLAPAAGAPAPLVALPVPHNILVNELAQARAEVAKANEQKILADQAAARESALRQRRENELLAAKQKIAEDARKAEAAAKAQRDILDVKYQAAFDQGQLLMSQRKYEAAIVALQGARQLKKSDAVDQMLTLALTEQAKVTAQAKGAAEHKVMEEKLAAEHKRAKAIEEEAKRNHEKHDAALKLAREALAQKNYDVAETQFQTAGTFFKNDAVLTGLKQVQSARAADTAAMAKIEKEKVAKSKRMAELLAAGKTALDAGNYADSVQKLEQARKIDPSNVEVLTSLSRAEQARDRALIEQRQKSVDAAKADAFLKAAKEKAAKLAQETEAKKASLAKLHQVAVADAIIHGQKAMGEKNFAGAIKSYQEALRLEPGQPQATKGLQDAQAGLANAEKLAIEAQQLREKGAKLALELEQKKAAAAKLQKAAAVAEALGQGQKAALAKNYVEAIKAYQEALRLEPGQPQATQGLTQAQTGLAGEQKAAAEAIQAKDKAAKLALEIEQKKSTEALLAKEKAAKIALEIEQKKAAAAKAAEINAIRYKQLVAQGQAFIGQKKFAEAVGPLQEALKLQPGDPAASLLRQAQAGAADAQSQQVAEQKKKTAYAESIKAGQAHLNQKRYAEAIQAFQAAKSLYPADPQANQLLTQTNQAWDAAKKAAAPPPPKKDLPKEPPKKAAEDPAKKKAAEDRVQYLGLITKGQQHMQLRQFPEAAQQFEAALRIVPGDPTATKLLQQARTLKK
jgi:tetratricopeptide (TPR) repeat protein/TolB-like protein